MIANLARVCHLMESQGTVPSLKNGVSDGMTENMATEKEITVADVGEFNLIASIAYGRPHPGSTLVGPGDDAAVLAVGAEQFVVSKDMLVEGRHFRRDWSPPRMIGRKVIAQNAADIAAMGGRPISFLIGLACPRDTPAHFVRELYEGLWEGARDLGTSLSGGDLVEADHIVISGTAIGSMEGLTPVTRGGAGQGHIVAVSGELGCAAAGLALLEAGFDVDTLEGPAKEEGNDLTGKQERAALRQLIERHQAPCPPISEGIVAARAGATAMIDISDGLVSDVGHLARASGVGIELDVEAIPIPWQLRIAEKELASSLTGWLLSGGEDHALVAVFPPDVEIPRWWTPIGRTVGREEGQKAGGPLGITVSQGNAELYQGWRSF